MSDVAGQQQEAPNEGEARAPHPDSLPYVDPVFAQVWAEVYGEEDDESSEEGEGAASGVADGDAAPAPTGEGAGAGAAPDPAQAGGAQPDAGTGEVREPRDAGNGNGDGTPGGTGDGVDGQSQGVAGTPASMVPGSGFDATPVVAELSVATEKISERIEQSFRTAAMDSLREKADPRYFDLVDIHPRRLVGMKVPALSPNGEDILIRDTEDAKSWQEATKELINEEIDSQVKTRQQDVNPLMGVIQDSVMLFQNNPDLIPNTKQYDRDLAAKVMEVAESYAYKINGKLIGFQTNLQPIINSFRAQIAAQRGAQNQQQVQARQEQQRQQAQAQARTTTGQFAADPGPQAGIESKAGMTGGEDEEDFSSFFRAMGLPPNLIL